MLASWRANAETTLLRLQGDHDGMRLERDEALAAAASARKALQQAEGLQRSLVEAREAAAAEAGAARSRVAALEAEQQRQQDPKLQKTELGRLRAQVSTAGAVVHHVRRVLATCRGVVVLEEGAQEPAEDEELDDALLGLKVRAAAVAVALGSIVGSDWIPGCHSRLPWLVRVEQLVDSGLLWRAVTSAPRGEGKGGGWHAHHI
jgi:predicted exporter